MTLSRVAQLSTVAALLIASAAACAQLPQDNNVWKMRCNVLASATQAIESGNIPPALAAATHGVPASQFITFALDRSAEGAHNVSCALFYLAAISDRLGNGAPADPAAAHNMAVLAEAEIKASLGQSLTFTERFKQASVKAGELFASSLTTAQLTAVIDAASTMPLTVNPPATESAQISGPPSNRINR